MTRLSVDRNISHITTNASPANLMLHSRKGNKKSSYNAEYNKLKGEFMSGETVLARSYCQESQMGSWHHYCPNMTCVWWRHADQRGGCSSVGRAGRPVTVRLTVRSRLQLSTCVHVKVLSLGKTLNPDLPPVGWQHLAWQLLPTGCK